jgi:hypothetical protein
MLGYFAKKLQLHIVISVSSRKFRSDENNAKNTNPLSLILDDDETRTSLYAAEMCALKNVYPIYVTYLQN